MIPGFAAMLPLLRFKRRSVFDIDRLPRRPWVLTEAETAGRGSIPDRD